MSVIDCGAEHAQLSSSSTWRTLAKSDVCLAGLARDIGDCFTLPKGRQRLDCGGDTPRCFSVRTTLLT